MGGNIALIGNPNCGKTTLFNALTGSNQYVGNWAGVTVEKKTGRTIKGNFNITDLPGIYSLSPYSLEERITRDYVINENPDAIINIIDGTNIERNLYLTVQLIELGKPMVLVINMMDDVAAKGWSIDCDYLSKLLGMPIVPISARKSENIDEVLKQVEYVITHKIIPPEITYDLKTQNALNEVYSIIVKNINDAEKIPYNFYAAKLLEGDKEGVKNLKLEKSQLEAVEKIILEYENNSEYHDREAMLADARYKFIEEVVRKTVVKNDSEETMTISDKIDAVVTNRFLAIPVFLLIMFLMFSFTFGPVGKFLSDIIEILVNDVIASFISGILEKANAPQWTYRLLLDGVVSGVGGILTFLPQIAILFFCLSILEDSGYMARAAFITDRFLRRLGLSGKSFIPMIMGFGCTTPAVMAARTQENINERRMTIMLVPFMSCGAKLTIYALFAGAFFKANKGLVIFSMYILGFLVAIAVGLLLKKTIFKGNMALFVMELPPYRMPMPKSVLKNTWDKCKGFLVKAGTVIFSMSIVIWLLQNFSPSFHMVDDSSQSIFGIIGAAIAPIFAPLGFGTWQASVSLLSGLVAKEAVVSSLGVLYGAGGDSLSAVISSVFTPLSAYSYMVFCLLYVPCVSAFATIKREMGSLKWALVSAAMQIGVAYLVSLLIYQAGSLMGRIF